MSKVKYRVREFTPSGNQFGTHSYYAEAVINNEIDNAELAKKIAARTGFKSYECQAIIAAIADIVSEEALESNRISLSNEDGTKMVSLYPKVSGSISDLDIQRITTAAHAADPSVEVRSVALESDLSADKLSWTLGATVGVKFSKQFALQKKAQKVPYNPNQEAAEPADSPEQGGNGGGNNGGGNQSGENDG